MNDTLSIEDYLTGKRILVTGGTGSFGNQIISQLLRFNPSEIIILSRDEKKQFDMMTKFSDYLNILRFKIADVRDFRRINELMKDIDIVYHAAALKQVPHCESNPYEAIRTNIIGAENIRYAAITNNVKTVIAISTDKAVKPVNVMGMTKALQEKIMLQESNDQFSTRFICVRYGNVIGSRGSVIPFFHALIKKNMPIPITHVDMTRFMLTLPEAISFVFEATLNGKNGELLVRKMPACKILNLARIMGKIIGKKTDYPIKITGVRPGEKIHEVLVSEEEMRRATETDEHYIIHPQRGLQISYKQSEIAEYTSQNTHLMTEAEIEKMLETSGWLAADRTSEDFD